MNFSFWFGTEDGYAVFQDLKSQAAEARAQGVTAGGLVLDAGGRALTGDDDKLPPFFTRLGGGVSAISVSGPLQAKGDSWDRYFGVTDYEGLIQAHTFAAHDSQTDVVVQMVDSPGGQVTGLESVTDSLAQLMKVKRVHTFSSGSMLSAALWIGVTAHQVSTSAMAQSGSIGVLATVASRARALKDAGIDVKVIRAGKYKALLHPAEPLSDEGLARLQAEADTLEGFFVSHVARYRKASEVTVREDMGEGEVFFGAEALRRSLVDKVETASQFFERMQRLASTKSLKHNGFTAEAGTGDNNMKKPLTDSDIAAIEAGVEDSPSAPVAAVDTPAEAPAETPAPAAPSAEAENALVAYLQARVSEYEASARDSAIQIRDLTSKLAGVEGTYSQMEAIVRRAVNRMRTPLGLAAVADNLCGIELLAAYGATAESFTAKFRIGGVASPAEDEKETPKVEDLSTHRARLKAVQTPKNSK